MTTYDPEDQAERRRVLQNDARVRNQSRNGDTSSYLDHAHSDLGGRFTCSTSATSKQSLGRFGSRSR
jgi:hypothetical protein